MANVTIATTAAEIDRCFPVMHQLRPLLVAEEFAERIAIQQAEGYRLAFLEHEGVVVSVAGFRLQTVLWSGRTLYVDDLVTYAAARSKGFGETMLTWLIEFAREAGCATFSLDSGTHRHQAHAFYFRHGLKITDFHFQLPL
ncbi:MAG TPA: GNAT family N-acetyltransferase [Edaphobacter sp.]|jgi:GNAT superfamily N-acetyltransferase|nr:GNAT family N-acetyltransferase [Edaphobacter sp.]